MVLANSGSFGNEIIADVHVLPATHITFSDGLALYSYLNSTKKALFFLLLQSSVAFISATAMILSQVAVRLHCGPHDEAWSGTGAGYGLFLL